MNEVQSKVITFLINNYPVVNINDDGRENKIVELNFGIKVFVQNDGNVFYEIDKMPKAHHFMLIVSKLIQGIENILNEREITGNLYKGFADIDNKMFIMKMEYEND